MDPVRIPEQTLEQLTADLLAHTTQPGDDGPIVLDLDAMMKRWREAEATQEQSKRSGISPPAGPTRGER